MYTSGNVSNIEYIYIEKALLCENKHTNGNSDNNQDENHCGNHDYCKYCKYNLTRIMRDCFDPEQNDSQDIRLFVERLRAKLQGTTYEEECGCDSTEP